MRTITVIAIISATAVGIIAAAILFVNPTTVATSEHEPYSKPRQDLNATASDYGNYRQINIMVNGFKLVADIAESDRQKSLGLDVKDSLAENEGMLFPFETQSQHTFWMSGMKFPIDIIWLDSNKNVVHIEHSLDPCKPNSFCQTYTPKEDSLYVLETVAGFALKHDVTAGTHVQFELHS